MREVARAVGEVAFGGVVARGKSRCARFLGLAPSGGVPSSVFLPVVCMKSDTRVLSAEVGGNGRTVFFWRFEVGPGVAGRLPGVAGRRLGAGCTKYAVARPLVRPSRNFGPQGARRGTAPVSPH